MLAPIFDAKEKINWETIDKSGNGTIDVTLTR
jgi:hypothetical protein